MGKFKHPGPGFLPLGLAIVLIFLSLILIFTRWEKTKSPTPFWPHRTWLRPLLGVVILILYALVIEKLGFIIITFVFLLLWMGVIERLRWKIIVSISVGTTAVLYLIFVLFLEVPLPLGILGW
jgi:putative tricarboxylic transport membrane protein